MKASPDFVHLHVHSQYSILDSSCAIQALVSKAKSLNMKALALTDHGNLFGTIEFYKAAKELEIKPIIGCEFYIAPFSRFEKKKHPGFPVAFHLTVLAKNLQGYKNLCKLSSSGYTEGFYYYPRIDFELLQKHAEGLICLSGCLQSEIAYTLQNNDENTALETIKKYKDLFKDDFYLELQRHSSSRDDIQLDGILEETWLYQNYHEYTQKQEELVQKLFDFGKKLQIHCVATNNVHYIEREDWKAHEILLNIQSGEKCEIYRTDSQGRPIGVIQNPKRSVSSAHEKYFKSSQEMLERFSDMPEVLTNTLEIADKCSLALDFKTKHYPVFVPPQLLGNEYDDATRQEEVKRFLRKLCEDGIPKRYTKEQQQRVIAKYPDKNPLDIVRSRLDYEFELITSKGMADYLLIVWDFIHWAKTNGIPMGPGRGSGAGSIILYLIGITDIEPLQFNLFFERFINPERLSYPDIDVDICMDRRNEVINYTIEKYGKENVAQIITFGSMKAKMTIKDVGRVLSIPLSKVNTIAKLIPDDLNITLEKAQEKNPELKKATQDDEETKRIIEIGKKLEGSIRNTGIHAAGIIISGTPLVEHIPVCNAKDSEMLSTQFSMKPVEMVGMLKIDFLGLKTLTSIQKCIDSIKEQLGREIDWISLPLDDRLTFSLLNQGKTQGVFQLESSGMQDLAKQLHLDRFEEIIAVLSLYRPGPMDMIPSFIQRKHKKEPIEYDHEWMKEILSETYGIMVYQEQVMQIASKLANYSLGEGDVLRRAMGKKDMNEMAKQRSKFLSGCLQNGIDESVATNIFDKMEKFAEYGFNKSHAAAYGYITYVTAYLKANFPSHWLASLMTCDQDDTSKIAKFIHECQAMNIMVLPPDVNESEAAFIATPSGIRYALCAIKGIGNAVVEAICEERKAHGPFKSLYDFISRIDPKKVGKKTTELLIDAGGFDFTRWHRDVLKESLDAMYDAVLFEQKEKASGILSLFQSSSKETNRFEEPPVLAKLRSRKEVFFREKELLGLFITGHPLDDYKELIKRLGCLPLSCIESLEPDTVFRAAFVIEEAQTKLLSKNQKKFAVIKITDGGIAQYEIPVWPEMYDEHGIHLIENALLWGVFVKEKRDDQTALSIKAFESLDQVTERSIAQSDQVFDRIKQSLQRFRNFSKDGASKNSKTAPLAKPEEKKNEKIVLSFELVDLSFSHILTLQSILASQAGSSVCEVLFLSKGKPYSSLILDETQKIDIDADLEKSLNALPSFKGWQRKL